ncbi:hypothetical protein GCM10009642_57410 [Nocardiopsis metallicus]
MFIPRMASTITRSPARASPGITAIEKARNSPANSPASTAANTGTTPNTISAIGTCPPPPGRAAHAARHASHRSTTGARTPYAGVHRTYGTVCARPATR